MKQPLAVAIVFSLCIAACGGGSDNPYQGGQHALGSGDHATALKHFEAALAGLTPVDAGWMAAKQGQIAALAKVDPKRAEVEAVAVLSTHHESLGENGATSIAGSMADGGAFPESLNFLKATVPIWPSSDRLDRMWGAVETRAASEASSDQMAELRSLGYLGGGETGNSASRRPVSGDAAAVPPAK